MASWLRQETAAEVEGLFVERDYRRQGIGGALIAACMAGQPTPAPPTIRLEVRASNAAALALYRRHGFSAAGVRRAYYSAPVEDALLLQAPLVPQTPYLYNSPRVWSQTWCVTDIFMDLGLSRPAFWSFW